MRAPEYNDITINMAMFVGCWLDRVSDHICQA
jgi:hypothetical protein